VSESVVPPREPHICWKWTRISANVSMITAMNTFYNGSQHNTRSNERQLSTTHHCVNDTVVCQWHTTVSTTLCSVTDTPLCQRHCAASLTHHCVNDTVQCHWHTTVSTTLCSITDTPLCQRHCAASLTHHCVSNTVVCQWHWVTLSFAKTKVYNLSLRPKVRFKT